MNVFDSGICAICVTSFHSYIIVGIHQEPEKDEYNR